MFRQLSQRFLSRQNFFRGSLLLATTTALSYLLGLWRDRSLAHSFGASQILSAYEAAFILPDLILNIFVASALSAAFVPIFNSLHTETDSDNTSFVSSVLNGALLMVTVVGLLVFIFIPYFSRWIVPGFDLATRQLFINLVRLLLLSPLIFAISNTLGNIILSREKFFWYGISAPLYNLGTIAGVYWLAPQYGIYGVAIGTLAGALLHLLSRIGGLTDYRINYRPRLVLGQAYRRFLRLMTPKMIQQPLEELTFFGFTIIASTLTTGAIVIMNFARNFQVMPVNTIGLTFSLAIFPTISTLAAQRRFREFKSDIKLTAASILIITIPTAIVIYLLRHFIINFIFGGGAFDTSAIALTASMLGVFCLSIPTESLVHILARGFYALKDSLTPVLVSVASLVVAVASGYWLTPHFGVQGLALGFFLGSVLKMLVLWALLHHKTLDLQRG